MTKWLAPVALAAGLLAGLAAGWSLARSLPSGPGRLLQVGRVPPYKPVELVPVSAGWPAGRTVAVATVVPPTRKERLRVERDFDLDLSRTSLLGKFDLPAMPDGGSAVVGVPVSDSPEPVSLIVKANPPPLLRVRWRPELEAWYGFASGGDSASRALYIGLPRLICIRDRVCGQARGGYEDRPRGGGWLAEVGVSIKF